MRVGKHALIRDYRWHLAQRYFPPGYVLAMKVMNTVANKALPQVGRAVRDDL